MDDLFIVLLCELGERILAMRGLLAEPAVAAKPHTHAVAALLARRLDAVEERIQRELLSRQTGLAIRGDERGEGIAGVLSSARRDVPAALGVLADARQALHVLHRRLGLLDLRPNAAPVDIFLRALRDDLDMPALPHPAVVLADDYAALDDDVAACLDAELAETHTDAEQAAGEAPIVALPRIAAGDPLAWPLLLTALARVYLRAATDIRPRDYGAASDEARGVAAVCLGGPAAFAARSAHVLASTPADIPIWPALTPLAGAAAACAGGLEYLDDDDDTQGFEREGPIALFTRLARLRDDALALSGPHGSAPWMGAEQLATLSTPWVELRLPRPTVPSAEETDVLLAKLAGGTPINAIEPPVPADVVARLDALEDAAGFYNLIGPLGERPASLAAILGVGWLYKVRHGYTLFRDLLGGHGALRPALAAYAPHLWERDRLLLQSIEAAHIQGIFVRGKADDHGGKVDEGGWG